MQFIFNLYIRKYIRNCFDEHYAETPLMEGVKSNRCIICEKETNRFFVAKKVEQKCSLTTTCWIKNGYNYLIFEFARLLFGTKYEKEEENNRATDLETKIIFIIAVLNQRVNIQVSKNAFEKMTEQKKDAKNEKKQKDHFLNKKNVFFLAFDCVFVLPVCVQHFCNNNVFPQYSRCIFRGCEQNSWSCVYFDNSVWFSLFQSIL